MKPRTQDNTTSGQVSVGSMMPIPTPSPTASGNSAHARTTAHRSSHHQIGYQSLQSRSKLRFCWCYHPDSCLCKFFLVNPQVWNAALVASSPTGLCSAEVLSTADFRIVTNETLRTSRIFISPQTLLKGQHAHLPRYFDLSSMDNEEPSRVICTNRTLLPLRLFGELPFEDVG